MILLNKEMVANSDADTFQMGFLLGKKLKAGDIVLLSGELGAGKTTFAKGIANAIGIDSNIVSPTFQIIREYKMNDLILYHVDMYRISGQEAFQLGIDELAIKDNILVIEWNKLEFLKKKRHYKVNFKYKNDNSREIYISLFGDPTE